MRPLRTALILLPAAIVACSESSTAPTPMRLAEAPASDHFEIFTQNLYVGADVDAVLGASPDQLEARLFEALGTFVATDWPGRATAIAAQIVRRNPAVVALNEVTTLEVSGLSPVFPDLAVPFLPILLEALETAGAHYTVAGVVDNIAVNLDLGGPTIRLRDADAILVRSDLAVTGVATGNYAARVTVPLGPVGSVELVRGWVAAGIAAGSRRATVVATHLEPKSTSPLLQLGQVQELIGIVSQYDGAVIVAGDLNSDPADPDPVTPYTLLRDAGFEDSWLAASGSSRRSGFTCCHAPSLDDAAGGFDERIDHLLVRRSPSSRGPLQPVHAEIWGDDESERAANGLWPSDHAGVFTRLSWNGFLR